MPGKPYIKTGTSTWAKVKRIYIKSGGQTWAPIRKAYIKTGTSTWRKVFDTTSNRPFIAGNDRPKIRLNTFRPDSPIDFSGTANDPVNPVVEAPPVQQMGPPITTPTNGWPSGTIGNHLWGYDGDWRSGNGSAISYTYQWLYNVTGDRNDSTFDPAFSPAYSSTTDASNTSSTGRADMLTNNSTYLGRGFTGQPGTDGDYFDKNFLTFRVVATNSAGSVAEESDTQLYIVRQRPSGTINLINTSVDVPETLSASFTYQNEWYRKPDLSNSSTGSYIEWFAIDSAGEALTTNNRVAIQYLSSISTTGTTTKSGTAFHNAILENKIYTVRITLNNSNTQSAVIPISGFIPTSPVTQEDSTDPGSDLTVTTLNILDYNSNNGTDNRGYIPVGGLFKIQSNVTGVNSSTTYRIRYRMFNWSNLSYYGMDGTNYGSSASSAWTTRTGSSTSFGFGGTLINQISVSGTTATLLHNEVISSSLFGSTTFNSGTEDRWQIEIEVSALKNSVRKYYADVVGGIPYYVSRPATLLLTASPENAQTNATVTLSGTITALGGGRSYPRQYKVSFGDGTDSGWLPVGEYSFGTFNPTFQITKQYSTVGEYFPVLTTIPDYSTTNTYVNVSAALTGATSTSIVSMSRLNDTTVRAVIGSSGASGPYYQLYWQSGITPTVTAGYDAAGTTSTVTEDQSFAAGTYYFFIRSSSQNLGNTTTFGTATEGTYSAYGPSTGAASFTFAQPTGSFSVSPSSGTAGTTLFTANASVTSAPTSLIQYQWQYFESSTFGWLPAPNSITSPFNNSSSTYTPPSNYASVYGSSLRCRITANNGVGNTLIGTPSVTVAAAATKLATPTNVSATDTRTDGIQVSWTNVANAATYGVWWGPQPSYDSNPDFGGPNNNGGVSITSTPFLDTGAPVGSRTYYVQAFPSTGSTSFLKSDWSLGDSGTRLEALSKLTTPTGVNATDTRTDGINITWNAVSGAAYYGVWYGGAPGYDSLADFGGNRNTSLITGTSYLDDSMGSGVTRDYYVQAYRSGDPTGTKSNWGGPDSGTRLAPVVNLTAPSIFNVVKSGSNYLVYFSGGSGPFYQVWWQFSAGTVNATGFDASGSSSPITITNLAASAGSTYYFSARSVSSAGNTGSGPSSTISSWSGQYAYTEPSATPPGIPTGVSLSGSGAVSWTASTGSPTSYEIGFYTAQNGSGLNAAGEYFVTGISGTSYQLTSPYASPNNWARVRVRARNSGGASSYSAWVPSETSYT
jgi:hypothetical protein